MTEQAQHEFDLIDDVVFFINNDPEFYRTIYFPLVSKFTDALKKGRTPSANAFKTIAEKAYDQYKEKFDVENLSPNLSPEELKDICVKLHNQQVEHFKSESVSEELDQIRKLAGINLTTLHATPVLNKGAIMKEGDIKPGSSEWFNLFFKNNTLSMTPSFRGRKK